MYCFEFTKYRGVGIYLSDAGKFEISDITDFIFGRSLVVAGRGC